MANMSIIRPLDPRDIGFEINIDFNWFNLQLIMFNVLTGNQTLSTEYPEDLLAKLFIIFGEL